jgi:ketosteroid isomerase-like protein
MTALTQADKDAIQGIADQVVGIANTKPTDWETYTKTYYTEDAIILPPNAPTVRGRAAIEEFFRSFPDITNFNVKAVEIDGCGDYAWSYGEYSMTLSPPDTSPVNDTGKYIEVWQRQSDGAWKVTRDIFNSDLP